MASNVVRRTQPRTTASLLTSLWFHYCSRYGFQSLSLKHDLQRYPARRNLNTTLLCRAEGDLGNPQSTSSEQSGVKTSRATKAQDSPDTASVQQPVSDRSAIPGDKDEGTPTEDAVKRDPKEPAADKRKSVESQGEKPLGPEDHQ